MARWILMVAHRRATSIHGVSCVHLLGCENHRIGIQPACADTSGAVSLCSSCAFLKVGFAHQAQHVVGASLLHRYHQNVQQFLAWRRTQILEDSVQPQEGLSSCILSPQGFEERIEVRRDSFTTD